MSNNVANRTIRRITRKIWLKVGIALVVIGALGVGLFLYPQPLFAWSIASDNLSIYSDQPFAPKAGRTVLEQVQAKLAASPLYSRHEHYAIFICNTAWRRTLFFLFDQHAGGLVYYPLSTNVFLSGANIEDNRLISPSGLPDVLGRKLDHFMAHEIAHDLTGQALDWSRYQALPVWIREGYAEYIGSQGVFDYGESLEAFRTEAPVMNVPASIPYRRYTLLVAYLLEKQKWTEQQLFATAFSPADVENMLKADLTRVTVK